MLLRHRLKSITAEAALQTVQAVALIIGGCWVLFHYLAHERALAKTTLQQQQAQLQQALALAETQAESEQARLRQLQLANAQAQLTLSRQSEAQHLSIEQQGLANEQARLTLQIAESQRRLRDEELRRGVELQKQDIELKRLQQQRAEHEIAFDGQYRYGRDFKVTSTKMRDLNDEYAEYKVEYYAAITNKSTVMFEISLVAIDYFVGVPKPTESDTIFVAPIGAPSNRWNNGSGTSGAIDWRLAGSTGSILSTALGSLPYDAKHVAESVRLAEGGFGVGITRPEQTLANDEIFYVRAPKAAYISLVTNYCFERCRDSADYYYHVDTIPLEEARNITAPVSLADQNR